MKTFLKELILNVCLYIFPLIFIISGITGNNIMLQVGVILAGIISVMMLIVYIIYFATHERKQYITYRKYLLVAELLILLICCYILIR